MLAFIITLYTFLIFFVIPTDTRSTLSGSGENDATLQGQFNLRGQSVESQYVHFVERLVRHGDLGRSIRSGAPVTQIVGRAVPVTASLVIGGAITWFLLAIPIGILSALRPRSLLDKGLMILVLIGASAHPLWLGLVLSYLLGFKLHVFPITGYCDFFGPSTFCGGPTQWAYHLLLPWLTFAFLFAALYARMIRASMLEAMNEDYVRTARAKGAGPAQVIRRHVLRNAMLPVVSMLVMGARPCADHGLLRVPTLEQDRRRDREDAVARRGFDVLVDVQLGEYDFRLVLALELGEDRLDCPAGPAPRRPEVDDHRRLGL